MERKSYLSPTKASLSRFHPSVLHGNTLGNPTTPGTSFQNIVNQIIRDVETSTTPTMANQFANNHDLDDLPATPTDAPYTPPRGIMASASNTGSKRKRSSPGSVEGEPSPIRQRVPTTNQPAPIAESNDLEALLARRDQLRRAMSMKTVIALSDTSDDTMQAQELLYGLRCPLLVWIY